MNLVGVQVLLVFDYCAAGEGPYIMVVTFEATQARWDVFMQGTASSGDLPHVGSGLRASVSDAWSAARRAAKNAAKHAHTKRQKEGTSNEERP